MKDADMTEELLKRLEAKAQPAGYVGIKHELINPDGPEAAARIRSLEAQRDEAVGLLRRIAEAPQPKSAGGLFTRALASVNSYVARLKALDSLKEGR